MPNIRIGGLKVDLSLGTAQFEKGSKRARRDLSMLDKELMGLERSAKVAVKAFTLVGTTAGIAFGAKALQGAKQFEEAFATIRRGTGATGKELEALKNDFKAVAVTADDSISSIGSVIADLNTRTGATGEPLRKLAASVLDLADITNTDLAATSRGVTRVFGDWSIATDNQQKSLDFLYRTSQTTGIELDKLLTLIVDYGVPLRTLGFSFEESAALLGKFEKEGVNTQAILGGLKQGLGALLKAGQDPVQVFQALQDEFKKTGDEAKLSENALKLFGVRAGPDMVKAISEGRFEIGQLTQNLKDGTDTIQKAADESKTLQEQFSELGNIITVVLAPATNEYLNDFKAGLGFVIGQMQDLIQKTGDAGLAMKIWAARFRAFFDPTISQDEAGQIVYDNAMLEKRVQQQIEFLKAEDKLGDALERTRDLLGDLDAVSREELNSLDELAKKLSMPDISSETTKQLTTQLQNNIKALRTLTEEEENVSQAGDTATNSTEILKNALGKLGGKGGAGGAATELEKLSDKLKDLKTDIEQTSLRDALDKAIQSGDAANFSKLKQKFLDATRQGTIEGLDEGVRGSDSAQEYADLITSEVETKIDNEWTESLKESHRAAVDTWQKFFENAITGVKFDFEDMLKQVAVGFAAELAASLVGNLNSIDISSPQGLGSSLAQSLLGGGGSGGFGGLTDLFSGAGGGGGGIGSLFSSLTGRAPGVQGPLLEDGSFGGIFSQGTAASGLISSAGTAVAVAQSIESISKLGKSSEDSAEAIGQLGGTTIGAIFGGAAGAGAGSFIGGKLGGLAADAFGLGGPSNAETLARIAGIDQLNEVLKQIGGLNFTNEGGDRVTVNSFTKGGIEDKFNTPDWAGQFLDKFGQNTGLTFTSLGTILEDFLGLEENVGEQLGSILGEQLGGSIEGLKALFTGLGISLEDTINKFIEIGLSGEQSWLEVESGIQKATEALGEGRGAVGDINGAFQSLINFAGRGAGSLGAIKNTIIEAKEAGVTTFDGLKEKLLQTFDPTFVEGFFSGLDQRGLDTFEAILQASDRTLGGVVADIDAYLQDAGGSWNSLLDQVSQATKEINNIPKEIESSINIKVRTQLDGTSSELLGVSGQSSASGSIPAFASGGVVSKPTLGVFGEAGPEAILPLAKVGGELGVKTTGGAGGSSPVFNVSVDARGAEAGVEHTVIAAIEAAKDSIIHEAINAVYSYQERGG